MTSYILVPGLGNSLGDHWQQHWYKTLPNSYWAPLGEHATGSWGEPDCTLWVERLQRCVDAAAEPVVFIGHSLGCLTIAHWAQAYPDYCDRIQAAWLVAVPDPLRADFPSVISGYSNPPLSALPFPSLMVTSADDPYTRPLRSEAFAKTWGCAVWHLGKAGHINTSSGYGPWTAGQEAFLQWQKKLNC